jgi:hypothetical protein
LNVFHPEWLGILSENPRCFDERDTIMPAATITTRPLLPPFTRESAAQKVRMAEDGWNTRDPIDSRWRNRSEFIRGRTEIIAFLSRRWAKELD